MTKEAIQEKKKHREYLKAQLQDLFRLYLHDDVAGDNEDRREKLYVITEIEEILDDR